MVHTPPTTPDTTEEPLAVIGMSCRFAPDLDTPGQLWEFLRAGRSAVGEMPARRWDPYEADPKTRAILRQTTRKGSFMQDIEGFDAEFFQITPREAEYIDPQQRIMLEMAWEALCDAGLPPTSLAGTDAGVYVAANSNDYGRRLLEDLDRTGAWAVNGTTFYGIANRISYFLDTHGPSMAVDTACAGSLTALHVACQGLRSGETSVAIVGGINIMSSPALVVALDAASATSPDGRSKAFDKAADGYGRGEGGGVVVLKRLSDAVRDDDPVYGLVMGSGVFQDGRSDGMMAPNSDAQQRMLEEVYERAGIDPNTVQYVEAHGTGTQLGDTAEARAIGSVFGPDRDSDTPLLIGTLKPNVGHVEAASGIAGVIKVLLGMRHGELPPSPHEEVNPELGLESSKMRLVGEPTPWPEGEHGMRAGVSSYGVGGSIAHAILQEPPAQTAAGTRPDSTTATARPWVFPVSAAAGQGVRDLAGAVADWAREHPDADLDSLAHTLTERRSHLAHRAAVVAGDSEELVAGLDALANGEHSPAVAMGAARQFGDTGAPGPVWVFSGHGAQWSGMGQELLTTEPAFARVIDELAPVFAEELGWTPREAIDAGGPWTVARTQAMTFAMQVALAEVWTELGLVPGAVIGHSVGEIAAAVVAGGLDRNDAARFACRRARALEQVAGRGAMAMVPMAFEDVERRLAGRDGVVAGIAASPLSTVVSGDIDAVEALVAEVETDGIKARKVNTDVAFHSPHVRGAVLDEVRQAAGELHARAPQVTLYSTAQQDPRSGALREGEYWATNLAEPVRFHQAVRAALDDGARVFLEVSSHPVVAHSITETALDAGVSDAQVAITLKREEPEQRTVLFNLARLHCMGSPVRWSYTGELVDVPAVRWQHRPFWIFPDTPAEQGAGRGHDPESHTLIGGYTTVASAPVQRVWQTELNMDNRPYAQSHKVVGVETVPASVVLNSFIGAAAAASEGDVPFGLRDIVFRIPIAAHPTRVVQLVMEQDKVRLASRIKREQGDGGGVRDDEWLTHTTATVVPDPVVGATPLEDLDAIRARCRESWTWEKVDDIFRGMGVDGYTFPWEVQDLRRGDGEQITTVQVDHTPKRHPSSWTAVVDAALTVSGVRVMTEDSTVLRTCSHLESLSYRGAPPARIHVHTTFDPRTPDTINMAVADDSGEVVCEAKGLRYVKVQDIGSSAVGPRDLVQELVWEPVEVRPGAPTPRQALLVGQPDGGPALVEALAARGVQARAATDPAAIGDGVLAGGDVVVVAPPALLPDETPEQAARRCTGVLVDAVQRIAAIEDEQKRPTVWVLTRGVRDGRDEAALAHAPLWGAGRIIAGERPDLWGGTIDVAPDVELASVAELIGALPPNEDVLSATAEGLFAARLQRLERPAEREPVDCRPDGTYLVTGGLGALGLEAARHLVEQGARRLVLVGRRGLPPRSEWGRISDPAVAAQVAEVVALEAAGATVRVLRLDISDPEATARALDPGALDMPPVRGIVHCAGVVSDALVEKTGAENLDTTMGPKADGAMVLHRLYPAGTLDFFTMFSSCGQLARLTGQVSYASANSFLDALAALRRAQGETGATSFAWAQWIGRGMGETTGKATILEAESRGLGGITVTEALRSWSYADRYGLPYVSVMRVMPGHTLPVFSHLSVTDADAENAADGAVDWSAVPSGELEEKVLAETHQQVAAELNLAPEDIAIDRPLLELGVDSVLTVALRVRLNRCFAVDLPPTILWSNPTVRALATFLATEVGGDAGEAETGEAGEPAAETPAVADEADGADTNGGSGLSRQVPQVRLETPVAAG